MYQSYSSPEPLIKRTSLLPSEFLFSLLIRLALLNSYEPPDILMQIIFEDPNHSRHYSDRLELLSSTAIYNRLAALTMLDVYTLYTATFHHFASILTAPPATIRFMKLPDGTSVPYFPKEYVPRQLRTLRSGQYCPACLKEKTYYPLNWLPIAISACLEHKCLLIDHCQECGSQLSILDIVMAKCDSCQADLTKAKAISIRNDELGLLSQEIIQSWFMARVTPESLASRLPEQPPALLYRIVDGVQHCSRLLQGLNWSYVHSLDVRPNQIHPQHQRREEVLSPYESYCLYTTACRSIMNWPESFYGFLDNYRNKNVRNFSLLAGHPDMDTQGKLVMGSIQNNLGHLNMHWLQDHWAYPEFKFLQEAFKHYIADNYWLNSSAERVRFCKRNPEFAEVFKYVDISHAANLLDTTPRALELVLGRSQIIDRKSNGEEMTRLVNRDSILYFHKIWHVPLTEKKGAQLLGLKEKMTDSVVRAGLFSNQPKRAKGSAFRVFTMAGIASCLEKIAKHTKDYPVQDQALQEERVWLDLGKAAQSLSSIGLNVVTIFLAVVGGKLWAYHPKDRKFQLGSLLFAQADIQAFVEAMKVDNALIGQEKAAELLQIQRQDLMGLVVRGFIFPVALYRDTLYFNQAGIDQFKENYLTEEQAARILTVDRDEYLDRKWASSRHLTETLVSGPSIDGRYKFLFDREKLLQWRDEHLDINEALQILGVDKAKLLRWTRAGKLGQLDYLNGEEPWFSKQVVFGLKENAR